MIDLSFLYVSEKKYIIPCSGCMGSDYIIYYRSSLRGENGDRCPLLGGKKIVRFYVLSAIHNTLTFSKGVSDYSKLCFYSF